NHRDGGVLPPQVSAGTLLDGSGNLLHALVARGLRQDPARGKNAVDDRQAGTCECQPQSLLLEHETLPRVRPEVEPPDYGTGPPARIAAPQRSGGRRARPPAAGDPDAGGPAWRRDSAPACEP